MFTQQVTVHSDVFRIDLIMTKPKATATGFKNNIASATPLDSYSRSDYSSPPKITKVTAMNAATKTRHSLIVNLSFSMKYASNTVNIGDS